MGDLSLILGTVLSQIAIGTFITSLVVTCLLKKADPEDAFKAVIVAFVVGVLGIGAMILHLGQPLHAMHAFFNLGRSWLSREVLFYGGFLGCTFLYILFFKLNKGSLLKPIGIIASICGICAVFVTSMIYTIPSIVAWNSANTPISFALTALMIGIPLGIYISKANELAQEGARLASALALAALLTTLVHVTTLAASVPAGAGSAHLLMSNGLFWGRICLLAVVSLFAGVTVVKAKDKTAYSINTLAILAAILIAAEFIGRTLFFGTIVRM